MVKISDKIQDKIDSGQAFFSFEYFPPKTDKGVENLFERMKKMAAFDPTFCDITWGAGGSTADLTTDIAIKMQNDVKVETMMHLTCTNMEMEKAYKALNDVKNAGVQNILALRGDPPAGQERWTAIEGGFECALDLVKYIRKEYGDFFGICVAGYPEAHPDKIGSDGVVSNEEYQKDLHYLKAKVDAGGEMVITQLFYDADLFLKFVSDCRTIGIKVPIIPGIMPIQSYGGFKKMTGFCKTRVPQHILDAVEAVKDDDVAVKKYGVDLGIEMCKKLLENGTPGVHMYSLNMDKTVLSILKGLGLIADIEQPIAEPREDESADIKQVAVASC